MLEEAAAQSAETFRTAAITADGIDLETIGLKRPTATCTYLVHEDLFGTDIDGPIRSIARRIPASLLFNAERGRALSGGVADLLSFSLIILATAARCKGAR